MRTMRMAACGMVLATCLSLPVSRTVATSLGADGADTPARSPTNENENGAIRLKALRRLIDVQDPRQPSADAVAAYLADDDPAVRRAVYEAVDRVAGLERLVAGHLVANMGDASRRDEIAYGFRQFGRMRTADSAAAVVLLEALPRAEGESLEWVATAARAVRAPITDEMALAVYGRDPVRLNAWFVAWAEYCRSPHPQVIAVLVKVLAEPHTENGWCQAQAANGLGQMGPGAVSAVPALRVALSDSIPHVRRYAVRALGMIGEAARPAADDIRRLVAQDPDNRVREWAAAALRTLTE